MGRYSSDVKRYVIIPDPQIKPGVPLEHIGWAAQALVDYQPDVIVVLGDWWDMASLSKYEKAGSKHMEGLRVADDINVGNEAFWTLIDPMEKEIQRLKDNKKKQWNPERHFLFGNHENRIVRFGAEEAKYDGLVTLDHLETPGFKRHPFLEIVELDGIAFSHYFSNSQSGKPIGGSIDNRLNKIGRSFVMGHQQGLLYGIKTLPGNIVRHGLVAGSFYLHDEHYRDAQSNGEWRGIIVLNEVRNGEYDIMPLSMDYLRRKYSNAGS